MVVSVLYVFVPEGMKGGVLTLEDIHSNNTVNIKPRLGNVVKFNGSVYHSISKVVSELNDPRVSLVCEQYSLTPKELDKFPEYELRG